MGSGVSPSLRVVQQVAAAEGVDPADLEPPLHELLDPDALDALVQSTANHPNGPAAIIEFTYRGHRVRVDGTGSVDVSPADPDRCPYSDHGSDSNLDSVPTDDSSDD